MRPSKSEMRGCAIGWKMTVGCMASLTLTGCMNNPTRGLSSNLSKDAAQAALAAEEVRTREQKEAALAKAEPKAQPKADAHSETPPLEAEADQILLAGGEEPAGRWSFFRKPAKEIQDPFSDLEKAVDEAEKPATQPAQKLQAKKPAAESKPVTPPAADKKVAEQKPLEKPAAEQKVAEQKAAEKKVAEKKSDEFDAEAWLKKELPAKRNPLEEIARQPVPQKAVTAEVKPAAPGFPKAEERPTGERAPQFPESFEKNVVQGTDAKANPFGEEKPRDNPFAEKASDSTTDNMFSQFEWSGKAAAVSNKAAVAEKKPEPKLEETADDSAPRLKVRALISDAHSSEMRGELRNAYRSAVIASKLADQEHLVFTGDQEDPRALAAKLSARIYSLDREEPASKAVAEKQPAAEANPFAQLKPAAEQKPVVEQKVVTEQKPAVVQKPAPELDAFAPAQDKLHSFNFRNAGEPAPAKLQAAAAPAPAALPQIRPAQRPDRIGVWLSQPEMEVPNRPAAPANNVVNAPGRIAAPPAVAEQLTPRDSLFATPNVVQAPAVKNPLELSGVEHAIAHSVAPLEAPPAVAEAPASRNHGLAITPPAGRVLAVPSETPRGPLLAPAPGLDIAQNDTAPAVTWEELARPDLVNKADRPGREVVQASSSGRWVWGLIGIVAAGASAAMGYRMSRRKPVEEATPVATVALPTPEAAPEAAPAFKIKRAA